jgi:hypothetical protein
MDERIDLTALELTGTDRDRLVAAIMARAQPELARRQSQDVSPIAVLSDWMRPALAAAAVLAVVCASVLAFERTPAGPGAGYTDALQVPQPADEWMVSGRSPTVADLFVAMEVEGR